MTIKQVNLYEAKTHLSQLVDEAAGGEEIVIAKNGKPFVKLMAVKSPAARKRQLGQLKSKVQLGAGFDSADAEIERLFYDGDLNDPGREFKGR